MNSTTNKFVAGLNKIIQRAGNQISFKYYTVANIGDYDDDVSLTGSYTLYTSGIIFPVNPQSDDAVLMEQGKIGLGDIKIYVNGSIALSSNVGSNTIVKVGIGSPASNYYTMIMPGNEVWGTENVPVFQSIYLRRLTGSLVGE